MAELDIIKRQLESCTTLLEHWRRFHKYIQDCSRDVQFTPQDEKEFLDLKSQIAVLHDFFVEAVKSRQAVAQAMISVVERSILLRQLQKLSEGEIRKLEIEWHDSYMLLNETIGALQDRINDLEQEAQLDQQSKRVIGRVVHKINTVLFSRGFQLSVASIALVVVLIVLPKMGVYSYDFLNESEITKKIYVPVRHLFRKTIMKELEFLSWEAFDRYYPVIIPGGFQPIGADKRTEKNFRQALFVKKYPGSEIFDFSEEIEQCKKTLLKNNMRGNASAVFLYALFPETKQARDLLTRLEEWRADLREGSTGEQREMLFQERRRQNVIFFAYGDRESIAIDLVAAYDTQME